MRESLTLVRLTWRKRRRNHRLVFGQPLRHVRLDWQRSAAVFAPGGCFAYERWSATKYGTSSWRLAILRAGDQNDCLERFPGVEPGAAILADRLGPGPVRTLFAVIDAVRKHADPSDVDAEDWRLLSERMTEPDALMPLLKRAVERCA